LGSSFIIQVNVTSGLFHQV